MKKAFVILSATFLAAGCAAQPNVVTVPAPQVQQQPLTPPQDEPANPSPWVKASSDGSYFSRREGNVQVLYKFEARSDVRAKTAVAAPYYAAGDYESEVAITVSDNGQLAAFNTWDAVRRTTLLFVENMDGTGKRQVAEQQAPEGHGELVPYSVVFTPDSNFLIYQERSVGENSEPITTNYIVDLASTTTTVLSGTLQFGYIKSFASATKKVPGKVVFGFSKMFGGDEANKAAAKDFGCGTKYAQPMCQQDGTVSMPNGFYIRDLKKSATYTLSNNAALSLLPQEGGAQSRPALATDLAQLVKNDAAVKKSTPDYLGTPFTALVQDGQIVLLSQVYIP